jgi:hypothetical protein
MAGGDWLFFDLRDFPGHWGRRSPGRSTISNLDPKPEESQRQYRVLAQCAETQTLWTARWAQPVESSCRCRPPEDCFALGEPISNGSNHGVRGPCTLAMSTITTSGSWISGHQLFSRGACRPTSARTPSEPSVSSKMNAVRVRASIRMSPLLLPAT